MLSSEDESYISKSDLEAANETVPKLLGEDTLLKFRRHLEEIFDETNHLDVSNYKKQWVNIGRHGLEDIKHRYLTLKFLDISDAFLSLALFAVIT